MWNRAVALTEIVVGIALAALAGSVILAAIAGLTLILLAFPIGSG